MTSPAYSYGYTDWDTSYRDTPLGDAAPANTSRGHTARENTAPGSTSTKKTVIADTISAGDALSTDQFIQELFAITGPGGRSDRDVRHLQVVARESMHWGPVDVAAAPGLATNPTRGPSVTLRITVLIAAIVAMVFLFFPAGVQAGSAAPTTISHVVQPGDTLWELAQGITPAGGDVRATVDLIRDANGMTTSLLVIGDLIAIPVLR